MTTGASAQEAAYDAVPFPEEPRFWSEPLYMGAAVRLFGLSSPPVSGARVLEIGCALGGNLLPMAARHPDAAFVGIDISGKQIAAARAHALELGLTNVEFLHRDIALGNQDLGTFDYVIAHGVFSWIPPSLHDTLLRFCRDALTPRGVCYISYNTYPYWHVKNVMRDFVRFGNETRTCSGDTIAEKIEEARTLVGDLSGIYGDVMREELAFLEEQKPNYLAHEYGETENHPIYVRDMIARAAAFDLSYACEVNPTYSTLRLLKRSVAARIDARAGSDRSMREQLIDFATGRGFRRSLFVKSGAAIPLDIDPRGIDELHILCAELPPSRDFADENRSLMYFDDVLFDERSEGEAAELRLLAEATIAYLAATLPPAEGTVPVANVFSRFAATTLDVPERIEIVRGAILEFYYQRKITFTTQALSWRFDPERPQAQRLIVGDAAHAREATVNVIHESIALRSENGRILLALLDGTRSRIELENEVRKLYESGRLRIARADGEENTMNPAALAAAYLDETLRKYARLRMLTM